MNLINEQVNKVLEDLELITNPYERSMVRTNLIGAIANLTVSADVDMPKGKDAIKTDIPKETKEEVIKETVEEPIKFEEVKEEPKAGPVEIDIDPNTEEEVTDGPIIVPVEDENGETVELDITEAYNLITTEMTQEEKMELAMTITAYSLMPTYESLSNLTDNDLKVTLAYQVQQVGLEDINGFVSQLTDERFNDLYEFVNNDNLEYLTTSIEEAMSDEE